MDIGTAVYKEGCYFNASDSSTGNLANLDGALKGAANSVLEHVH